MFARIIITALVGTSLATPVVAQDEHSAYVIVDKSARASQALMKHRIAVAVEEICRSYAVVESYQWPEVDACRKEAWASARRQLAALAGEGRIALSSR
jgi:hypothetical protein